MNETNPETPEKILSRELNRLVAARNSGFRPGSGALHRLLDYRRSPFDWIAERLRFVITEEIDSLINKVSTELFTHTLRIDRDSAEASFLKLNDVVMAEIPFVESISDRLTVDFGHFPGVSFTKPKEKPVPMKLEDLQKVNAINARRATAISTANGIADKTRNVIYFDTPEGEVLRAGVVDLLNAQVIGFNAELASLGVSAT